MRAYSLLAAWLFILPAVSFAGPDGAYKAQRGPHRVGVVRNLRLNSPDREYPLPVLVRYPRPTADAPGPFPLVIFSHGAGGNCDAFATLSKHWTSYGYIVVHPTHSDSIRLRRARSEKMKSLRDEMKHIVRKVNLVERCNDVTLILDSLDDIEQAITKDSRKNKPGEVPQRPPIRIDRDRVALAGHSAGAMTTQTLAGVKFHRRGRTLSFPDTRIEAFTVISGQGTTRRSLNKYSWSEIRKPMLVITGSRDFSGVSDENPASRRHPFEYSPPGDKYLLFIDGATHSSYAGKRISRLLGEKTPDNIEYITDIVAFGTLAFLDAHLKQAKPARQYLASDAITTYPGGKTEFKRK